MPGRPALGFLCDMLFNSGEFLFLFLPLCLLGFSWFRSSRARMVFLLLLSIYFYMVAYPAYIFILFGLIGVDYLAALQMDKKEGRSRKAWLWISLGSNVLLLASFKYYNFFADNLLALGFALPKHQWLLPVGLSFHTFQSMSYTVEVYRKAYPVERNLLRYSLYVLFFPQMVAGPIERPQNILPQFNPFPAFRAQNWKPGLFLLARGLFMKVAVADRLSPWVDQVFSAPEKAGPYEAWLAVLFFGIQIYADFSGYSNMALGSARLLGIDLMVNFKQPYLATSLSDFWRRWHVSLSTWFRDYIYIPLGGNRVSAWKSARNLLLVFALSGLWHGAGWNFIVWGALHGLFLVAESRLFPQKTPRFAVVAWIRTQAWVFLCWVFFRASSLENGLDVLNACFASGSGSLAISLPDQLYGLLLLIAVPLAEWFQFQEKAFRLAPWFCILSLALAGWFLGNFQSQSFIYFQF